jgi:cytochrome c-type biogenesis protein
MDWSYVSWAFLAGAAATVNPCGIAMLPAYVSFYLGQDERQAKLLKGLSAGLLLAAGTFSAFTAIGLIVASAGTAIARFIPWAAVLVAVLLLVAGIMTLLDRAPSLTLSIGQRASGQGSWQSFYSFGLGYGLASLGCTLPIFLIVVSSALGAGFLKGLTAFVAYGLGMGLVLTSISFAVALGKTAVLRWLRRLSPGLKYIGGFGLLIAGSYLIYYNLRGLSFMITGRSSTWALYLAILVFGVTLSIWLVLRR